MTFEELQRAAEALTKAWEQLTMTVQEFLDAFDDWAGRIGIDIRALIHPKEEKSKSTKHAYHFPSKHRHVKSRLVCAYAPNLKVPRNLPYQRRNY